MTEVSEGCGWWLAFDGKRYSPESHPRYGQPPPPPSPAPHPLSRAGSTPSCVNAKRVQQRRWLTVVAVGALIGMIGVVIVAGLVMFATGEDLFGSDPGTIDSYNRDVLETCEVPTDSTLVRTYILPVTDGSGVRLRTMSYIYASPLPADDVAAFFGVAGPGVWTDVAPERACRFGNRPSVLVLSRWTAEQGTSLDPSTETAGLPSDPNDEFWAGDGAQVTDVADPPMGTRSFVRLRLAQRDRDGLFGLAPARPWA